MPWRPRADRGSPPHDRAASLLLERLDGLLERDEAQWLDAHLAGCRACRALGDAFDADRAELRSLRRQPIEPPRDLWARTSSALEREARGGAARRSRRRPTRAPLGAAAGLLVVAVVVGATMLSGRQTVPPDPSLSASATPPLIVVSIPPSIAPTATAAVSAAPTPLSVPSGDVPYLAQDDEGNSVLLNLGVSEVCSTNGADCAPIQPSSPRVLELPNAPRAVIQSPDEEQLIVVDEGAKGDGGTITLVPVPTPAGSGEPSTTAPPVTPSPEPPTPTPALTPTPTPTTPATASATTTPTPTPTSTASPTATTPLTPPPTGSADPTSTPTLAPSPTGTATPSPTDTATPSATATATAIAEDVVVDGSTAAFSADGRLLAFSARPADGSHGPDIYLWATDGTAEATPITTDHRSVFAGWLGDMILGSRVVDETDGAASDVRRHGEAFLVDPETGDVTVIPDQAQWRPSVDPTGSRVVYWDGSLDLDDTGNPVTDVGRLVLASWAVAPGDTGSSAASAEPSGSAQPEATAPLPSEDEPVAASDAAVDVLAEGPLVDWDARWDDTGTHLAVWIADPDDPTIGKLSLYIVDPETGRLNSDLTPLRDARALPGFAIGDGKLVWATPPGQDAEASHVSVLAWTAEGVGQVESHPAEDIVVIR